MDIAQPLDSSILPAHIPSGKPNKRTGLLIILATVLMCIVFVVVGFRTLGLGQKILPRRELTKLELMELDEMAPLQEKYDFDTTISISSSDELVKTQSFGFDVISLQTRGVRDATGGLVKRRYTATMEDGMVVEVLELPEVSYIRVDKTGSYLKQYFKAVLSREVKDESAFDQIVQRIRASLEGQWIKVDINQNEKYSIKELVLKNVLDYEQVFGSEKSASTSAQYKIEARHLKEPLVHMTEGGYQNMPVVILEYAPSDTELDTFSLALTKLAPPKTGTEWATKASEYIRNVRSKTWINKKTYHVLRQESSLAHVSYAQYDGIATFYGSTPTRLVTVKYETIFSPFDATVSFDPPTSSITTIEANAKIEEAFAAVLTTPTPVQSKFQP